MSMNRYASPSTEMQERRINTYNGAVIKNFRFLKNTEHLDDLFAKSISLAENQGFLVPICQLHIKDTELIVKLATWREENSFAYPTQFPVTFPGTKSWLQNQVLDNEGRILFLVLDKYGNAVGHLGFANCINNKLEMEIDNVVRGIGKVEPGIMANAMKAIMDWAQEIISPEIIYLRVFNDNERAVRFYSKLGFEKDGLIPLRRYEEGAKICYRELPHDDHNEPDKYFLKMTLGYQKLSEAKEMILTAGPSISAREASYALDAARYGWNNQWNKYIKEFESVFANYIGTKYALATSSCTGALHLALASLGIGPGDEVVVPDITWVATANAVVYVGATPVFADIELGADLLKRHPG